MPYAPTPTTGGRSGRSVYKSVAFAVAIGVTAFAVFFAFGFVKSFLATRSGEPTVSSGGGSIAPLPSPGVVTIPTVPAVEPSASSAPQGSEVGVSGVGENKTIECNDAAVTVSGVSNTVVLTGHCASVTVSGVENVVTVDSADVIGASGLDNRVTFHAGTPEVQNPGDSNVVEMG